MPQKRSLSKSKRDRLEEARSKLREPFEAIAQPWEQKPAAVPEEIIAQAWELANDIESFVRKYLPHYMVDQETGKPIEPAAFHREIYQLALTHLRVAFAAPREHAKSTVVSLFLVLYFICHKLRRFIVVISDTQAQAALLLGAVKAELEGNDDLRADFGALDNQDKWGEYDFVTTTGIRLVARGAGQSLRGLRQRQYRPDMVICDDLEDDEKVDNPQIREKLENWFKRVVLNLGKRCQVFVIGTILHYDSLLSHLLDPEKYSKFHKRLLMAVDDDWDPDSVLWPGMWPVEALKAKEEDIGAVDFDQEYRNRPLNKLTQEFQEEWFVQHAYTLDEIRDVVMLKIMGVDPAISQKEKADFFGKCTIGIGPRGHIFVLRAEQKKIPFNEQVKFLCERYDDERPEMIGIESVAYQRALKQRLDEVSRETRRYIPVKEVEAKGEKFTRIKTMAPLVENGTIRFRMDDSQKVLRSQLLFLGKTKDDVADALEIAVRLARDANFSTSTDIAASGSEQSHSQMGAYC